MVRDYAKALFSVFFAEFISEGPHEASGKMPFRNQVSYRKKLE